jgi:hypothetical protein
MTLNTCTALGAWALLLLFSDRTTAEEPPEIPVALDAYRQWERWPYQRIGARAYMRSTYDRAGGNEGADASHFLYQQADDFNVTLDVEGPGVLYFARYNHWHGSPWHYEVDGTDHLVQESSSSDPTRPVKDSVFLPDKLFPRPLAWTWSVTKGADLSWVPVPFERSFRMAYSRTHYGTGYYIYHQYVRGAKLSRPLRAWDGKTPPDADVLDLIGRAGSDLAPRPDTPEGKKAGVREQSGKVALPAKEVVKLVELTETPAMLRALELTVSKEAATAFSRARLRVTWDDRRQPSIDAPVALFYGTGTLYNRDGREYLVKGFPIHVRDDGKKVHLACYFPMPFFRSARIELVGPDAAAIPEVAWSVRYTPYRDPANHVAYFHATYADHPRPEAGKDLALLHTRKIEGSEDWSGHLAGTSFIFSHQANLTTLEGDPRFFFDDSLTPQADGRMGRRRRLLGRPQHDPSLRRPPGRRGQRQGRQERRGQDRVGLPLPAGRRDALRQERTHLSGARGDQRIHRALRDSDLLVRYAQPFVAEDRRVADWRRRQREGAPLPIAGCLGPIRDHVALRVGGRPA